MPKSNVNYWKNKLYKNKECDEQNQKELKERGGMSSLYGMPIKKDKQKQTLEELYNHIIIKCK